MKTVSVVLFVAFAATPAFAECPEGAVQSAATLVELVGVTPTAAPSALTQVTQLAKDCPTSPHVQKLAGFVYGATLGAITDPQKAYEQALAGWNYTLAMRATRSDNEKPIDVMVGDQTAKVDVSGKDNYEQNSLRGLLITEANAGKLAPQHQPLKPGEKPGACGKWDAADAQYAAFLAQENPARDVPGAMNLINRAAAACEPVIGQGANRNIFAVRAQTLLKQVKANPKRSDAEAMLLQAQADARRYHAAKGGWDAAFLSEADAAAIDKLIVDRKKL